MAAAVLGLALIGFVASADPLLQLPPAFAQETAATYDDEVRTGREHFRRKRYEDALKSFKRANELKGKTSAEAFFLMAQAYMGLEAYKNTIQSCDKTIELAGSDNQLKAQAYNLKGIALQKQWDGKDPKKLQEAEEALRQGLSIETKLADLHFNLGMVLLQQKRDPEGIAELQRVLEMSPNDFNPADVRKFIANPRRAREPFAPEFSLTTSEGEYLSLDELRGKVVLLDFWGTWCPPCVAAVPALRDLNKKYAKDSSFMMIGISSDGDANKWRDFTAREKMVWPQYLDAERKVQRAFGVRGFPTYIVLDAEGVIRYRATGMSFDKEAALEEAIRKQMKLIAKPTD